MIKSNFKLPGTYNHLNLNNGLHQRAYEVFVNGDAREAIEMVQSDSTIIDGNEWGWDAMEHYFRVGQYETDQETEVSVLVVDPSEETETELSFMTKMSESGIVNYFYHAARDNGVFVEIKFNGQTESFNRNVFRP